MVMELDRCKHKITYCKAAANYTEVYMINKKNPLIISKNIGWIEEYLFSFIRPHRSYLVNPTLIKNIDKSRRELLLNCGVKIEISRRKFGSIEKYLK